MISSANIVIALQVRVLTDGAVRGAVRVFDALCGHAAPQDPPLLLMFMLMTGLSGCAARLCSYSSPARATSQPERASCEHGEGNLLQALCRA